MAIIKEAWLTNPPAVTTLTVTGLGSLVNGASAISQTFDNFGSGAFEFSDTVVTSVIGSPAANTSASGYIEIYIQPSIDNTNFADSTNDILVDVMNVTVNSTTFIKGTSLAKSLQGTLPPYFRLRYFNQTGGTLASATITYNMLYYTVI